MPEDISTPVAAMSFCHNEPLHRDYERIRNDSVQLCAPLELEDYGIQTMAAVSPPKWHLAHTAWFFETMLLKPYLRRYREYHPLFARLFNSYYDTLGGYHPRQERGLLSRPTVADIIEYRHHVDGHMHALLEQDHHPRSNDILQRTTLGLHHEQQHQELLLTDIKHIFAYSPLRPAYRQQPVPSSPPPAALQWHDFPEGIYHIGHHGDGFAFDNETPSHKTWLQGFRLASRPVLNGEYFEFIADGGYRNAELWLSDAWQQLGREGWQAPLYWEKIAGSWWHMTLSGLQPVDEHAPVTHVSFYEAAAYARWAGKRLPREQEWEIAAASQPLAGNFRDSGILHPQGSAAAGLTQLYGDTWEWTQSPYVPYPGYRQAHGPLGEYNGKFMSSQMVLRGGSCVSPREHIRSTYRNFFYPHERWQFTGFRLAEDS